MKNTDCNVENYLQIVENNKNYHSKFIAENSDYNVRNVLSLFSGCGGMDLGFEGNFEVIKDCINENIHPDWISNSTSKGSKVLLTNTCFKTIFANDIKKEAQIAWTNYFSKRNVPSSIYWTDSIVNLVKLYKEIGLSVFPKNIDVVTGGFPCQDFSIAGKRLGFNSQTSHDGKKINDNQLPQSESRGQLYMWMKEVISIVQPKVFVAENVKGLVNLGDVKKIIERDFSSIGGNGYIVVNAKVLHAADYGVPQSRERVIFLGFKKSALKPEALKALSQEIIPDEYNPYPNKTHSWSEEKKEYKKPVTLSKALSGLQEPNCTKDLSQKHYSKAKYMGAHCQGQTEIKLDSIGPTIRSEHHGNIEYRRLSIEHGGKYIKELEHGKIERRLTIRECARIQTFPDDYEFVFKKENMSLSASEAYKVIGNAVPPLLGYHIAKRLEKLWDKFFK